MKAKRNYGGGIDLDLGQAKTSELIDEEANEGENKEMSEQEVQQK